MTPEISQPSFWVDPYRREILTRIVAAGKEDGANWVELEDTLLFPEGGGQPSDQGWLDDVPIVHVHRADNRIVHRLDGEIPGPGLAKLRLNWPRRYDHMQQHTAQHLLTAIAQDVFGWPTTAFHLGSSVSDVELDIAQVPMVKLRELEATLAGHIRQALPVTARWSSDTELEGAEVRCRGLPQGHTGPVRLVEIEGLDRAACSGTHLYSTAELEAICLLGMEQMRGGTRVFFVAGSRVRDRMAAHEDRNRQLRSILGAPDLELAATAESKLQQLKESGRENRRLAEEITAHLIEELVKQSPTLHCLHFRHLPGAYLRKIATGFAERSSHGLLFLSCDELSFVVADASPEPRAVELGMALAKILEARGGGKGALYQGKAQSLGKIPEAMALLKELV